MKTPRFTKKHYREIAGVLRKVIDPRFEQCLVDKLSDELCRLFQADNPKFNKNKFLESIFRGPYGVQ